MQNILIIDDHKLIFGGLNSELSTDFKLYYSHDITSAVEISSQVVFHTAIVDISLGDESGFDLAEKLTSSIPFIFFLSMHKSSIYVQQAQSKGYNGYFLKDDSLDLLIAGQH